MSAPKGGWTALAAALTWSLKNSALPYTAVYVPPANDTVDGDITFMDPDGKPAVITLQVGEYGAAMNENEYRDGELVPVAMLRCFEPVVSKDICAVIVKELRGRISNSGALT